MDYTTFQWKDVKDTYNTSKGKVYKAAGIFDEMELERLKYALVDDITIGDITAVWDSSDSKFDFDELVSSLPKWKKEALTFLHYIPRSKMLPRATNAPMYHSMTPIFLWGLKEKWNTWNTLDNEYSHCEHMGYSNWKGDTLKFAFPHMLWTALEAAKDWSRSDLMLALGDLRERREEVQTYITGKKKGQRDHLTGWKCNTLVVKHQGEDIRISAMLLRMVLQLWLCNVAYRQPGVMVLDPWDWDAVPEPLDDSEPVQITRITRKVAEWEDLV